MGVLDNPRVHVGSAQLLSMHKRLLAISIVSVASLSAASPADPVVTWVLNRSNFVVALMDEFGPSSRAACPASEGSAPRRGLLSRGFGRVRSSRWSTGFDPVIDKNGDVTTSGGTLIEQAAQGILGDWKDEAWLDQRHANDDREWDLVFSEANHGNATPLQGTVR